MKWPTIRLGQAVVDMQPGFACAPVANADGLPQLRTNNVSSDGRIDLSEVKRVPATTEQLERYTLSPGDVLFNNTNSPALVGKTALFSESGTFLFSNHMTRIRTHDSILDPRYVAHFLHYNWGTGAFKSLVTQWVNQAAINRTQLVSIRMPLPPLSEQRRIVEILNRADELRRLRAEADAKAERILPALFIKMFGDPAAWSSDQRAEPLGKLVEIVGGCTPSKMNREYWEGMTPWISPKDMKRDFLGDGEDHVSECALADTTLRIIQPSSVLIVVRGMILAHSVPVCLTIAPLTINQDMKALIPKDTRVSGPYLWASLKVSKNQLLARVGTAAHGTRKLETPELLEYPVVVPSETELNASNRIADWARGALAVGEVRRKRMNSLFSVLLQRAFSALLTRRWREAHLKELLQEMEQQARALSAQTSTEVLT